MIYLIMWLAFGLIVGLIAKFLHPGDEPVGCLPTIGIGVAGSFIGGAINYCIHQGNHAFHSSGFLMSIVGGIVFCMIWRYYTLKNSSSGPKNFFNGKRLD